MKMQLEDGSPVALIGKKMMKSIGIVLTDQQLDDETAVLHPSMLANLR